MSFEIKDLAGIGEPARKLLEMVQATCGTLFKPSSIRSEADARAYERVTMAKAEAEAEAARIAKLGDLNNTIELAQRLDNGDGALIERAKQRLALRKVCTKRSLLC